MSIDRERFITLIEPMLDMLSARQQQPMAETLAGLAKSLKKHSPAVIYKWREGKSLPNEVELQKLVEIGVREAGMDRAWATDILESYRHPDQAKILSTLFAPTIPHNLPHRACRQLIGRETEREEIIKRLSPEARDWIVPIEGIGGVGKSTLALEIGWHFAEIYDPRLRERQFDAIVWASAKDTEMTPKGVRSHHPMITNRSDIFRACAEVLNYPSLTQTGDITALKHAFSQKGRVLLIIDNLETVDDPEVLDLLHHLPWPAKALVTLRWHEDMPYPIHLRSLDEQSAQEMIRRECEQRGIEPSEDVLQRLARMTGGLPLAISLNVGLMSLHGYSVQKLEHGTKEAEELLHFIFDRVVQTLGEQNPHALDLLRALAFFDMNEGATGTALAAILDLSPDDYQEAVQQAINTNLINRNPGGHFTMLPLTRTYVLEHLKGDPAWLAEARTRWVAWYLDFTAKYGGEDWDAYGARYEKLRAEWANILAVLDWCAATDRYDAVKAFWIENRIRQFTSDYGYFKDRLLWSDWLIREARQRQDWPVVVEMLSSKGWVKIVQGTEHDLAEAGELFREAWENRHHVEHQETYCQLITHIVDRYLRLPQKDLAEAGQWLDRLAKELAEGWLTDRARIRQEINLHYYHGITAFARAEWDAAKSHFEQVREIGKTTNMHRAASKAQNWLGDIARVQNRLQDAEQLVQEALDIAIQNSDFRRIAYCRWSLAKLKFMQYDVEAGRAAAQAALHEFERLGMARDAAMLRAELPQAFEKEANNARHKP